MPWLPPFLIAGHFCSKDFLILMGLLLFHLRVSHWNPLPPPLMPEPLGLQLLFLSGLLFPCQHVGCALLAKLLRPLWSHFIVTPQLCPEHYRDVQPLGRAPECPTSRLWVEA